MDTSKIEFILRSASPAQATTLTHVVLKVLNGCLPPAAAVGQARSLGLPTELLEETLVTLGFDTSLFECTPLSPNQRQDLAEKLDRTLSQITRRATAASAQGASLRLDQLRRIPVTLA